MPVVNKITAEIFNTAKTKSTVRMKEPCTPPIQMFNGLKTQVSNEFGVVVPRGMFKTVIFVPNAWLGEIRWNRVFGTNTKYDQTVTDNGVVFMFDRQ